MAQLDKKPCPGDWSFDGDWDNQHNKQFKEIEKEAAKVDLG